MPARIYTRPNSDPNSFYSPSGGVDCPEYELWQYPKLVHPLYSTKRGLISDEIPCDVVTKYSIDVQLLPSILKIEPIPFGTHLTQEFSAPKPNIRRPSAPTKLSVETLKRSLFFSFVLPGIYELYFKQKTSDFQKRSEVISYNKAVAAHEAFAAALNRKYENVSAEWNIQRDQFNSERSAIGISDSAMSNTVQAAQLEHGNDQNPS